MELNEIYPPSIDINAIVKKARFFIGDKWIEIGPIEFVTTGRYAMDVKLPDIDGFIRDREYSDDGSVDWYFWGPRVN